MPLRAHHSCVSSMSARHQVNANDIASRCGDPSLDGAHCTSAGMATFSSLIYYFKGPFSEIQKVYIRNWSQGTSSCFPTQPERNATSSSRKLTSQSLPQCPNLRLRMPAAISITPIVPPLSGSNMSDSLPLANRQSKSKQCSCQSTGDHSLGACFSPESELSKTRCVIQRVDVQVDQSLTVCHWLRTSHATCCHMLQHVKYKLPNLPETLQEVPIARTCLP